MQDQEIIVIAITNIRGLLTALAAGPVFGGNTAPVEGFRALSGGGAAKFALPPDVKLIQSFPLPAYGLTYERYQQSFGAAQVFGGQLTLYKDGTGATTIVIGNHYPDIVPTNKVERSNNDARKDVARDIGPEGKVKIDLMINPVSGRYYHRIETQRFDSRWFHWIDAGNGKVLNKYNGLATGCGTAPDPTKPAPCGFGVAYDDGDSTDVKDLTDLTTASGSGYQLVSADGRVETHDQGSTNRPFLGPIATDSDDLWIRPGDDSPAQPALVDAHYYANLADAYFLDPAKHTFDWQAVVGDGSPMNIQAHFKKDYNNAYWSGLGWVALGDGDQSLFRELVSLDVVGHELTHGVTDATSDLVYQDQSGALNESFSDMLAAAMELYAPANNQKPWHMGESFDLQGDGIRNMGDPEADGHPDHNSEFVVTDGDAGGVHTNSGIPNHWFYLLAQPVGEININASCASIYDGSGRVRNIAHCVGTETGEINVTGIGITDAEQIAFATFIALPQNATFRGTRLASQVMAETLFLGGTQRQSVSDAWEAVGVEEYEVCDTAEGFSETIPFYSAHPYANEIDCVWSYANPTANFSFHFSMGDLETGYDFIYIMDADYNVLEILNGSFDNHTTVPIPTIVGRVRLVTDQFVIADGFIVDGPAGGGGGNTAPTALDVPDNSTNEDTPDTWFPDVSDPDIGDTLTCSIDTQPTHGTATVVGNCSSGTYTPETDFNGPDPFAYSVSDGNGGSDTGAVSVTVNAMNDAPVANDVSDTTTMDTGDNWFPDVSDPDAGDALSCTADATSANGGSVFVNSDCSSGTYDPVAGSTAPDSFNYKVCDSEPLPLCNSGTVAYTVSVPSADMHIGDLDGVVKGNWKGVVTATVHDSSHNLVANATVTGTWDPSGKGAKFECTTDSTGTCDVNSGKMNGNTQTTFTVTGVSGTLPYQSGDNHDEDDADASDGTSITVTNP